MRFFSVVKFVAIWPGIGLLGLAIYQLSVQNYEGALNATLSALAVFGLRKVDHNTDTVVSGLAQPK